MLDPMLPAIAMILSTPSALGPAVDVTNTKRYQADAAFLPDKTSLWKAPIAEDGWVHAHNAIRGEIDVMTAVFQKIGRRGLEAWEVSSLQAWWSGHVLHLHDHHANEDDKFSPYMQTRIKLPPKLTTDHVPLVRMLDVLGGRISQLRAGSSVNALRREWMRYEAMMKPHLHEEEQIALPLLRAYFTPAEVGKLVESILSNSPPVSLGSFFYFMGGTREACAQFMENEGIPFFVWFLAFRGHVQHYHERMVRHTDALLRGVPPPPVDESSTDLPKLALTALALVAGTMAYRRMRRRSSAPAPARAVYYSIPKSVALQTLSPSRKATRTAGCPSTPTRRVC